MKTRSHRTQPDIEYIPPTDDTIHQLVQKISQQMARIHDDAGYLEPNVIYGLRSFIKLISVMKAKHLNQTNYCGFFDNSDSSQYP